MMLLSDNIIGTNLYAYCYNNPVMYADHTGYLAANVMKLVNGLSASAIFASYAYGLSTAFAATMTKIGLYVTGILLPKITALFWWQPWVVAGIVVAAVAIVITAVTVARNVQLNKIKGSIPSKLKLSNGKIDLKKFNNPNGPKMPKGGRAILGPLGWYIVKDIDSHKNAVWKLFNWAGERIASLLSDGTIIGK